MLLKKKTQKTTEIKNYREPNIVDIKSVIIEHSKNLHKLFRVIRQAKNISIFAYENSDIPLKSETKTVKIIWMKKMKRKQNHLMLIKVKKVLIVSKF